MKQLNISIHVRSISFNSDGIYTVGQSLDSTYNYFELSNSELTTLTDNINKMTLPQIVDDDVIYFDKRAAFPKLLLGRLDLKVKRTIKADKCTKLVVNEDCIITPADLNALEFGYIIFVGGTDESDCKQAFYISQKSIDESSSYGITLDLMQKYFPGRWKKIARTPDSITAESIELINSAPEKITTVQNVALYLNSQLSQLDSDSAKTMISLFKSGSEEKKLAVNMIASFNISPILYDICEAIGTGSGYFDNSTKSSINYKYFKLLLGVSPNFIESDWKYGRYYQNKIVSKIFNNPLVSPDQKYKAWNRFNENVKEDYYTYSNPERRKNTFETYNMPLSYDPRGATSTSDSEMEGQ